MTSRANSGGSTNSSVDIESVGADDEEDDEKDDDGDDDDGVYDGEDNVNKAAL